MAMKRMFQLTVFLLIVTTCSCQVTFSFRMQMLSIIEGAGVATVYIDREGNTDQTITLSVTGPLQSETSLVIDQTITFGPLDTAIELLFNVTDDSIALEETEVLEWFLEIITVTNRALVDPYNSTIINIIDDDELVLTLEKNDVDEAENAISCISFSTQFARDFSINTMPSVPVNVTIPDLAVSGEDYMTPPSSLQALSGMNGPNTPLCFEVPIVDDELVENEECFGVSISLPSKFSGLMLSIAENATSALCCIQDNDKITIGFVPDDYSVDEDDATGTVTLTIGILEGTLRRLAEVIFYTSDGTATSIAGLPEDFMPLSDITLQFDENTQSLTVTVAISNDDILEDTEFFLGNLNTSDDAVNLLPSEATVEILERYGDDDVTVGFNPESYTVGEGGGVVNLVVELLDGTLERTVTVLFETSPGGATGSPPADYQSTVTTLTFTPAIGSVTVPVVIFRDTIVEGNETFFGHLVDIGDPVILAPQIATVLITEDEVDNTCPAGTYRVTTADGDDACMVCPANSVITTADSPVCECIQGYYRHQLEDASVPCTRPPSACRNLQVIESRTRANTITVMWERPLITGRDDFYYNIHHSNPDLQGSFLLHNINPFIKTSPLVRYSVSGLRPLTNYTIRVSVLNAVSDDQDTAGEEGRRCEVTAMTGDINPQAPRSVTSFCEVIVWQAPSRAYGAITGYDVMFADTVSTSNSSMIQNLVLKDRDQLFHVVRESDLPRPGGAPTIQVRAKTVFADGIWSPAVSINNCSACDGADSGR